MRLTNTALILCLIASNQVLNAQVAAGRGGITGVVVDASGATVPNAQVVVDNERLGIHRALNTSSGGVFNVPALVPSAGYQVTVNAPGFSAFVERDITILVGHAVSIHAALGVEAAA